MTENPTETATGPVPVDAPKDAPEDTATGYAVYDRTIGQYVGGVTSDKPSSSEARRRVAKGHVHAIVRV